MKCLAQMDTAPQIRIDPVTLRSRVPTLSQLSYPPVLPFEQRLKLIIFPSEIIFKAVKVAVQIEVLYIYVIGLEC